jgi:hypothetical protein
LQKRIPSRIYTRADTKPSIADLICHRRHPAYPQTHRDTQKTHKARKIQADSHPITQVATFCTCLCTMSNSPYRQVRVHDRTLDTVMDTVLSETRTLPPHHPTTEVVRMSRWIHEVRVRTFALSSDASLFSLRSRRNSSRPGSSRLPGQGIRLVHHVLVCNSCCRIEVQDRTSLVYEGRWNPVARMYLNENWYQCFHCLVDEAVVAERGVPIVEEAGEKADEKAVKGKEQNEGQGAATAQL